MKFEIHFTLPSGDEDFIVLEGETVDELREMADREVEKRGGTDPWSVPLYHRMTATLKGERL